MSQRHPFQYEIDAGALINRLKKNNPFKRDVQGYVKKKACWKKPACLWQQCGSSGCVMVSIVTARCYRDMNSVYIKGYKNQGVK